MQSHADIVNEFGGLAELARAIDVRRARIAKVKTRGIPPLYWLDVERAAQERGIPVTAEVLKETAPPRKHRNG
jgi:hypothetical protein